MTKVTGTRFTQQGVEKPKNLAQLRRTEQKLQIGQILNGNTNGYQVKPITEQPLPAPKVAEQTSMPEAKTVVPTQQQTTSTEIVPTTATEKRPKSTKISNRRHYEKKIGIYKNNKPKNLAELRAQNKPKQVGQLLNGDTKGMEVKPPRVSAPKPEVKHMVEGFDIKNYQNHSSRKFNTTVKPIGYKAPNAASPKRQAKYKRMYEKQMKLKLANKEQGKIRALQIAKERLAAQNATSQAVQATAQGASRIGAHGASQALTPDKIIMPNKGSVTKHTGPLVQNFDITKFQNKSGTKYNKVTPKIGANAPNAADPERQLQYKEQKLQREIKRGKGKLRAIKLAEEQVLQGTYKKPIKASKKAYTLANGHSQQSLVKNFDITKYQNKSGKKFNTTVPKIGANAPNAADPTRQAEYKKLAEKKLAARAEGKQFAKQLAEEAVENGTYKKPFKPKKILGGGTPTPAPKPTTFKQFFTWKNIKNVFKGKGGKWGIAAGIATLAVGGAAAAVAATPSSKGYVVKTLQAPEGYWEHLRGYEKLKA